VDVTVRNGEVTLRGTVESDLLTQLLPEAVQRVPGVVSVKSRLVAQPTDTTPVDVGSSGESETRHARGLSRTRG
jgi:hypothetical protein